MMDYTPSLQSTLHHYAIVVNSTTPNVICILLNKWYFAFTFPVHFAMVMSPQAASGLDRLSASRHRNEAQTQRWLQHPCLLRGPKLGGKGYITPASWVCRVTLFRVSYNSVVWGHQEHPLLGNKISRTCTYPKLVFSLHNIPSKNASPCVPALLPLIDRLRGEHGMDVDQKSQNLYRTQAKIVGPRRVLLVKLHQMDNHGCLGGMFARRAPGALLFY